MSSEEAKELIGRIEKLKKEKEEVRGTECEVYSRIVGYLRPVQSWNNGKKEEFKLRNPYKLR